MQLYGASTSLLVDRDDWNWDMDIDSSVVRWAVVGAAIGVVAAAILCFCVGLVSHMLSWMGTDELTVKSWLANTAKVSVVLVPAGAAVGAVIALITA